MRDATDARSEPTRARRRVPRSLAVLLALIALDLLVRVAAWRWWPWPDDGPGQPVRRHAYLCAAALLLWAAAPLVPPRRTKGVFSRYAEGEPETVRIGAAVLVGMLLLSTAFALADGLRRAASEAWF